MKPIEVDNRGRVKLLHNSDLNWPPRHQVWKRDTIKECGKCGRLFTPMTDYKHECKK